MDIAGDDAGVWMTYEELAVARDIKRDAARRLAQRHRWRRHAGNDGLARVLVPVEWTEPTRDNPRDKTVVTALQGAIDTLRQQLARADARSDEMRAERDQARAEARKAQEALDAFRQAEADRKARSVLARLRAAWRGE